MQEENQNKEEIKIRFFEAIKSENATEIVKFFRNENLEVWKLREEDEYTALHRAAFMNLTLIVNTMIDEIKLRLGIEARKEIKKWVNEKSDQGHTAIHYAAYRGNIEVIQKLIQNGAEIEVCNNRGLNVLHMASQGNQPGSLVFFKEKFSMNILSVDDLGSTPLHWGCYTGSEAAVLFLLSWNINVNAQDREGLTPLHLAVMSERSRILKKLLQKGADKKIKDNKGRTAFDLAVSKNKLSMVEMLKEKPDCQFCVLRAPLQKTDKNSFNIFFFFILHILIETSVFCALLPFMNSKPLALVYITLLFFVVFFYIVLIYSDSGALMRDPSKPLIRLVEDKVDISDYCPICQVLKTNTSKHCVICDKCVEGFDHHCYWVNNCIGKGNLYLFVTFVSIIALNIITNIIIAFCTLTYDDNANVLPDRAEYPYQLPSPGLYTDSARIVISGFVVIIGILFLFPVVVLLIVQIRNALNKWKKSKTGINRRPNTSSMNRNAKASKLSLGTSREDKAAFLLQNLRTDDENVVIVENWGNEPKK